MDRRFILSPDADAELESARRWYQLADMALSFRFLTEIQRTLRRIVQNPYQFPLIDEEVRRALLKRFPYAIHFRLNKDIVNVIAVVHQCRSPDVWLNRPHGH